MIISCPQCAKKFHLEDKVLPSHGFKVRCSHCSLVWRAEPPVISQPYPDSQAPLENPLEESLQAPSQSISAHEENDFLKNLKDESHIQDEEIIPPGLPPFPPRLEEERQEEKSFAKKIKLDWIVLAIGVIIFLFVFLLDNFFQASIFPNLTRSDTYSVDRKNAEAEEKEQEQNLPQYKAHHHEPPPSAPFQNKSDDEPILNVGPPSGS